MELLKKSDRVLKVGPTMKGFKGAGLKVKDLGEYSRWKDIEVGQLQVTMNVWEIVNGERKFYLLSDSLDRIACNVQTDKKEVFNWLKEHGYKTTHDWYIEDNGMSEETWRRWNSESEE